METGLNCVTAQYQLEFNGSISVYNRGYYYPWYNKTVDIGKVRGQAKCNASAGSCTVGFFGKSTDGPANYNILGTDYENYSVVYNCENKAYGLFHTTVLWILSRTPVLSEDKLKEAQDLIQAKIPGYPSLIWAVHPLQGGDCQYED